MEKEGNNRIHKIDEKGRVSVPVSLRKELKFGEKLILTKGIEKCIYVFSQSEWINFLERIREFPLWDESKRKAIRFFSGESEEVEIDAQGRILIPKHLKQYAGIQNLCFFVKMPRWFEIWNPEIYREYSIPENIDFKEIPL
ncbi:MAG: division/cell wall cluster transcriptional repressor MraZ [candidate division WOR-3 bacterium]